MGYYGGHYDWRPYVSAAQRRRNAEREIQKLRKKGHPISPVVIEGRAIARTFWGDAWCKNLERYSDFENRLPRGRTYVRNGSVLDLQISAGKVDAKVNGTSLYDVTVTVAPVPKAHWSSLCGDCAGAIDSLVELLQGRLSQGVMERICQEKSGLFPAPKEIKFECSCPDWASMCKHVAAVLYGVGARLDDRPELLFKLRKVDEKELIAKAGRGAPLTKHRPGAKKVLAHDTTDLAALFGLELDGGAPVDGEAPSKRPARTKAKPGRGAARRAAGGPRQRGRAVTAKRRTR